MRKLFFLTVLAVHSLSFAQASKGAEANVANRKVTEVTFEGDIIDGTLTKPDVEYVDAHVGVKHSNLIKIREDFRDKVIPSVGEL